ncbi:MAG: S1 RNA-binding domain-containing protein [Lachnospiraceae bacterium]|nr:S1 RNA-binding domain-containing protein [Lachnospiraceae bacterium]
MSETMEDYAAELEASFKTINEGDILTGTVIDVSESAVTLDLKYYTDGIIRLEDFSDEPGFSLKDAVTVGDEISATVIRRDDGEGHILLSKKEANQVLAWDKLKEMMENKTVLTVKISDTVKAGAIAYVEGIRGFIPASKLSLDYVEDTSEWMSKTIRVQIITVDEAEEKLVLSAKELLQEQAAEERNSRIASIPVGLVTEGVVETLQNYGAFVRLENGLSGLVHISQISNKRIKSPAVVLHVGDKVKVKVIDTKDGKISLSMKALEDVTAEAIEEETYEFPETEEVGTSLGSLFANIKLN